VIFQHTIDAVLSRKKTQTSRVWKPYYRPGNYGAPSDDLRIPFTKRLSMTGYGEFDVLWSVKTGVPHVIYHWNGIYSVQPGRGKPGKGHIRISHIEKRDVRDFTIEDIRREGFSEFDAFFMLWEQMHGRAYDAVVMRFHLIKEEQGV